MIIKGSFGWKKGKGMKNNWYQGVKEWLDYVRNYKINKETDTIIDHRLIEYENKINKLKEEIKKRENIEKEKDKLILLRDQRLQTTTEKYSSAVKRLNELRKLFENSQKEIKELQNKVEDREKRRRANATTIGQKQRKINKLEKEMAQLEENHKLEVARLKHRINFLENSKHAPSKEEILAYEKSMKEVEKRIKAINETENRELQDTNN